MSTEHGHSHHDAGPDPRLEKHLTPEQTQALEARVKALESLLIAKGMVSADTLTKLAETYEHDLGPMNGAKVVAHAWVDPAYKQRLLTNATAAIAELGFGGLQGEHMVVVENTPKIHNLVVCTLCSCYPWPILGLLQCGTKAHRTALALLLIPVVSCASSVSSWTSPPRCVCGIAVLSCATWCSPSVQPTLST
jgi:hypothetical protein